MPGLSLTIHVIKGLSRRNCNNLTFELANFSTHINLIVTLKVTGFQFTLRVLWEWWSGWLGGDLLPVLVFLIQRKFGLGMCP